MKSLARSSAVAALLVVTLAGCDGGTDGGTGTGSTTQPTPITPTAEPADGTVISNDDFSFTLPDGWAESEQSRALSLAVDLEDQDGFPDNIHVVMDRTLVELDAAALEDAAEDILADGSATQITTKQPVQIDGAEAVHTSAYFELSDPRYRTEQYAVVHDETGYVVTLSFSPDVGAAERDKISESILATWEWES